PRQAAFRLASYRGPLPTFPPARDLNPSPASPRLRPAPPLHQSPAQTPSGMLGTAPAFQTGAHSPPRLPGSAGIEFSASSPRACLRLPPQLLIIRPTLSHPIRGYKSAPTRWLPARPPLSPAHSHR